MNINISKRNLVKNILGIIYQMAPGCYPRNIDKIHKYILNWCNKNVIDYKTKINSIELNKYLKDMLMKCEEFTQLNISQKNWDKGIRNYNSKENSGFVATYVEHNNNGIPCNIYSPEEYNNFIDLDALIRNITSSIINDNIDSEDCFLCKFSVKYGKMEPSDCIECKTCIINPNYKFNRIPHPKSLLPVNSEEYRNYKDE